MNISILSLKMHACLSVEGFQNTHGHQISRNNHEGKAGSFSLHKLHGSPAEPRLLQRHAQSPGRLLKSDEVFFSSWELAWCLGLSLHTCSNTAFSRERLLGCQWELPKYKNFRRESGGRTRGMGICSPL